MIKKFLSKEVPKQILSIQNRQARHAKTS
jgi:hypothetical protein